MVQSAVTVSLVPQARGGPFVFWDDLEAAMHRAAELGFDAVEIFAPGPRHIDRKQLRALCENTGLTIAAVGTGAGWVIHKLNLSDADSERRVAAVKFVQEMIEFGAEFAAPAIIGSMQGRAPDASLRKQTLTILAESLRGLGDQAQSAGVPLIYEPLNRYETNLCNTMQQGAEFINSNGLANVVLLADLFHMNIEEVDLAAALTEHANLIGHIHFVDSNRRAAGYGHIDFHSVAAALKSTGYDGYLSAEALPWPDPDSAARQTFTTFRRLFSELNGLA